jgi:hypothetical protein
VVLSALLLLRPRPATGWNPAAVLDSERTQGPSPLGPSASILIHVDGPPTAHTGGFGEPTCRDCHADFPLNEPGGVLRIEGLPDPYEPGAAYVLTVALESGDMARAGFQTAIRFLGGLDEGQQAGHLGPISPRIALVVEESSGVHYLSHSGSGSVVGPGGVASWSFEWRAPTSASPVVMHVAANSANGDDSPLGDLIYVAERTVGPAEPGLEQGSAGRLSGSRWCTSSGRPESTSP